MTDRVHLVFSLPNHPGKKVYFHRLSEVSDGRRGMPPQTAPVFNDEIQFTTWLTPEIAVQQRDHWRRQGYTVVIKDREDNGPLFEGRDRTGSLTERTVHHSSRFVALTGGGADGLGYFVRFSPERRQWYCRSIDIPSMLAEHKDKETLWADSPEAVAQKILDVWGLKIAQPFDDPEAVARQERERQQAVQQKTFMPGIRPGDRR
jgi:hypothetical protein